jgi:hypothetical protein
VVTGAGIALVRQHDQLGGGQLAQDAPDPGRGQVVHGTGQRPRHPHNVAVWSGDDLEIHSVTAVLAGVERPVRRDPVDRDERAVKNDIGVPSLLGPGQRLAQLGRAGCQQAHGLGDISPGGSGADAEPGGQLGERLPFAQVGQYQQSLPRRGQLRQGEAICLRWRRMIPAV